MPRPSKDREDPNQREVDFSDAAGADEAAAIEAQYARKADREAEVVEIDPADMTDEIAHLIEALQSERDEAIDARKRALADYANFQKRAAENEARARQDGQMSVIHALTSVIDHLDLALNQDASTTTAEQMIGGMRIVQQELLKAIEAFGVSRIEPTVGDEFDPMRHEAMLRRRAEGVAPNHIVAVYQPGFAAGSRVLRPAKVAVAPEEDDAAD